MCYDNVYYLTQITLKLIRLLKLFISCWIICTWNYVLKCYLLILIFFMCVKISFQNKFYSKITQSIFHPTPTPSALKKKKIPAVFLVLCNDQEGPTQWLCLKGGSSSNCQSKFLFLHTYLGAKVLANFHLDNQFQCFQHYIIGLHPIITYTSVSYHWSWIKKKIFSPE